MTSPSTVRGGSQLRAIFYMCLATVLLFPALNATVKVLGADYSVWQVIWVRSIMHLVVMVALCAPGYGLLRVFTTTKLVLQLIRSALQVGAMYFFMSALKVLPPDIKAGFQRVDKTETDATAKAVLGTMIRNTDPGSNAGIPGLSLFAGMTKSGLPVGIEIDGPVGSDRALLSLGLAIEALLGTAPSPASK